MNLGFKGLGGDLRGVFCFPALQPVFWLASPECEQPSAAFVCFLGSILLPCLGLRIAYLLFMTVKSKKSRWARTVITVENGTQWPVEQRCQIDSCGRITQAPLKKVAAADRHFRVLVSQGEKKGKKIAIPIFLKQIILTIHLQKLCTILKMILQVFSHV